MAISNISGANAYGYVNKLVNNNNSSSSSSGASGASGSTFGNFVADAAKTAVSTIKNSETVSMNAIAGKASLTDVVTAMNSAEVALKSVVAIRDKVISAYNDIIKMPI